MKYSASLMVAVFSAAPLVVSAPGVMAAPAPNPSIDPLIRQAHFWQSKGRTDLTLEAYKRVLALSPTNAEAKAAVAAIQSGQGGAAAPSIPAPAQPVKPAQSVQPAQLAAAEPDKKRSRHPKKTAADISGPRRVEGFKALNENDLEAAETNFRAALALRSGDGDSLGGLGVVYLRRGQFAQAQDYLSKAAHISGSKWDEALKAAGFYGELKAGQAALDRGDLPSADHMAHELVDKGDDATLSATRLLANVLQAEGRPGDAAKLFKLAADRLKGGPDAASLRINAVRAEAQQDVADGDVPAALAILQTAIVQDMRSPWLRHDYAELLLSQGRKDDALAVIAPIESDTSPDSLYAASLVLVDAGRTAEADRLLSGLSPTQMDPALRQLAIDVKVSEAIARAKDLSKEGRSAEALAELQSLSAHTVASPSVLGDLALALLDLKQSDKAAELALKGAKSDDADPLSYSSVISALARTGQDKAAADLLDRLAKRHGAGGSIRALRALYASAAADRLRTQGQLATAFDLLQSAWAVAPGNTDLLGATARLYAAGHMYIQAGQVYELILKTHPTDTQSWLGLARAAADSDSKSVARKALEHAIESSPSDPATLVTASEISVQIGDRRAGVAYLERARKLVDRQTQLADGSAFPTLNPFTNAPSPGEGAGPPAPINPFQLASVKSGGLDADLRPPVQADILAASGAPTTVESSLIRRDLELHGIDQQIDALEVASAPYADAGVQVRNRTGESGLSALSELQASVRVGGSVGDIKLSLTATPTVLESGSLSSSALARYGSNATPEAEGIVAQEPSKLIGAPLTNTSGVGLSLSATDGPVTATVGSTPLGFERVNAIGGVVVQEQISPSTTVTVGVERRAVDDSVTSYAGSRDPVTGKVWGAVTRNQASADLGYDKDGVGLYVQANGRVYDGVNVKSNAAGELNVGGYITPYKTDRSSFTLGLNVNFQGYANDQDFFTLGHGGYFSPQDFAAVSLPLNLHTHIGNLSLGLAVAPGYQTFNEASAPVYPTSASQQALLDQLKAENNDVRAQYDSTGESGFAMTAGLTGQYPITRSAMLDLGVSYNSFGPFQETQAGVELKQTFGADAK